LSWPTARAEDAESCGNHPGANDSLTGAAKNWQTPDAGVFNDGQSVETFLARRKKLQAKKYNGNGCGIPLAIEAKRFFQARNWPTPDAVTGSGGPRSRSAKELRAITNGQQIGKHHRQVNLSDAAALALQARNWPTPRANDFKSGEVSERVYGKNSRPLAEVASRFSRRARTTSKRGANFSDGTPRLNPRFVEHLMGLIPGWTGSAPLEIQSFRLWLAMHSSHLRALLRAADSKRMTAAA